MSRITLLTNVSGISLAHDSLTTRATGAETKPKMTLANRRMYFEHAIPQASLQNNRPLACHKLPASASQWHHTEDSSRAPPTSLESPQSKSSGLGPSSGGLTRCTPVCTHVCLYVTPLDLPVRHMHCKHGSRRAGRRICKCQGGNLGLHTLQVCWWRHPCMR